MKTSRPQVGDDLDEAVSSAVKDPTIQLVGKAAVEHLENVAGGL